jgi:amino acid transporter
MTPKQCDDEPVVSVQRHPPERRRPKTVTTHCGCCCCCCCCLHSVGALIGAASGSVPVPGSGDAYYVKDEEDPSLYRKVEMGQGSPSKVIGVFWTAVLVLMLVGGTFGQLGPSKEPGLALLFFYSPHLILAALAVTGLFTLITYGGASEGRQLGRIALSSFIGFVVGYVIMCLICQGPFPLWGI